MLVEIFLRFHFSRLGSDVFFVSRSWEIEYFILLISYRPKNVPCFFVIITLGALELLRNYSSLLNLYNGTKLFRNRIVEMAFKLTKKKQNSAVCSLFS